uniref:Peptidase aspartic putative domain-containing protein n=1 Tax=Anopheles quadriannulatus TaxID=34691 RepID=A0A182XPD6_ANOQN
MKESTPMGELHVSYTTKLTADQIAARQTWPKKLPTFSGTPRDWPKFYNSYVESTGCMLEECLTGGAREVVEGWFDSPQSVPLIIKTLQRLFGKPSLVAKDMLAKIRQVPAPGPERLDELITFGLAVQHLCNQLSSPDRKHYLSNHELLEELVEKLPASRRLEWVSYKFAVKETHKTEPSLQEFGQFMKQLVEKASEVTTYTSPKTNFPRIMRNQQRSHIFVHSEEAIATSPATPDSEAHTSNAREAFLDEGSSLTLVETVLAQRLGLKGNPDPMELHWTSNVTRKETASQRVSMEISAMGDERRYSIAAAHNVNKLSLPLYNKKCNTLISTLNYLQDVPLHTYDDPMPQLLIGLADVNLIHPLETRSGHPGEPIAVGLFTDRTIQPPKRIRGMHSLTFITAKLPTTIPIAKNPATTN